MNYRNCFITALLLFMFFQTSAQEGSFPGGERMWLKFVDSNIDRTVPSKSNAKNGYYTTIVQFAINKDGSISDIKPISKNGYGMEEEFIRVIKLSPNWNPATVDGKPIKSIQYQFCTFHIPNDDGGVFFQKVETESTFPGGSEAWKKFLQENLKATVPVKQGAPVGLYRVMVEFIVEKDGSLTEFKATTNHGYGMESEVLRIMKKSPNWVPATQNGRVVRSFKKLPVTFVVGSEKGQ